MPTPIIESHKKKTRDLAALCKEAATFDDTRIQGYLAKSLAIMASAYIEICIREEIAIFCSSRSHPVIKGFVQKNISYENSLNCAKIEKILSVFDSKIWSELRSEMTDEQASAIDSLKALRDQIAHGKDNNTGYSTINKYFESIVEFPVTLSKILKKI